jgi:hypothetical protein
MERPSLACPECGIDLIPAHGRGRFDRDGNEIVHRDECRCRWCDWWWYEDEDPVTCACGAVVGVSVDDDHAYTKLISAAGAGGEDG